MAKICCIEFLSPFVFSVCLCLSISCLKYDEKNLKHRYLEIPHFCTLSTNILIGQWMAFGVMFPSCVQHAQVSAVYLFSPAPDTCFPHVPVTAILFSGQFLSLDFPPELRFLSEFTSSSGFSFYCSHSNRSDTLTHSLDLHFYHG